jgi:demethoxyubiquinone hydroxylase (CLK1/Coq7/Cat5 family)
MAWSLDDINWTAFDPSQVNPDILAVVKAAAMVERNAADYTKHLVSLFHDDADFLAYAAQWRHEEEQHGDALGKWAEMMAIKSPFPKAKACAGHAPAS